MNLTLDTSVQYVPRVGPRMAGLLGKLGIETVKDLLFYAPFRYNDYTNVVPIGRVVVGQTACVRGTVESIKNIFTKTGKKLQQAIVTDATGRLTIIWFNQLYLPKVIHPQDQISLAGPIDFFGSHIAMMSPDYELLSGDKTLLSTGRLVPVYSETAGLTSKWIRGRIDFLFHSVLPLVSEYLPKEILQDHELLELPTAVRLVHFPETLREAQDARRRLAFDELLRLFSASYLAKKNWRETKISPKFTLQEKEKQEFIRSLPFTLTGDQMQAIGEMASDLQNTYPMNRLLEGEVGSGKTVVSAYGMYTALKNGYSAVMLAPTQILAEQHYQTIKQLLNPFGISVHLLMGGNVKSSSNIAMKQWNNEAIAVFIGTHALLEETVNLSNIGLVVVDEQQRFGVRQRAIIRKKGTGALTPHFLTMTATPIPRTIALTLYGNLDLSELTQMPKGRLTIKTWVVPKEKRENAYRWIRLQLAQSETRVFIVCPFIEQSESLASVKAAKKEFERLRDSVFPDIPMGLLHGKLKAKEKNIVLSSFRKGDTKILVTTPVVEVGIDIPEASVMLVEAGDRFGLAQLHQLRGRVGRSDKQSYCLIFTESEKEETVARLKILERVQSGPELAEYDLTLRGEGDIFGIRQHGIPALAFASLSDKTLVADAQTAVSELVAKDPTLSRFPPLREWLEKGTINKGIQD